MFNKYRNIKLIGSVIIVLALVITVAANLRFRSVKQYNEDASRIASEQESLAKEYEENLDDESDSNFEDIASDIGAVTDEQGESTSSSDLNKTDIEGQETSEGTESGNSANESSSITTTDNAASASESLTGSSGNSSESTSAGSSNTTSSSSTNSGKSYIKVTIRITVAVLLEEGNYSRLSDTVKASIPSNGDIAYETLYLEEGSTVLDALVAVANKNGISITNSGGYVSQIAGFGEKIFGGSADYSGWTYYLNHNTNLINVGAGAKKLTDGDYICWWYTTNWGDYKGY
ncbi:MAG: DUF4430 domain-containing protein [Lachnospira sp.]|nr:DUF4430 domain-containing protein [Lachnospira sp.]